MTQIDDGQSASITNAKADAADDNNTGSTGVPVPAAGIFSTPVFVSATPQQLSTTKDVDLYLNITTAAAMTLSIGPTSAGTLVPVSANQSNALGVIHVRVPVGWYVKFTGTVANVVFSAITR